MAPGRKTQLRVLSGFDVPEESRGFAAMITLVRIFGRLNQKMAILAADYDLTVSHFEVLLTLRHGDGINQQELSDRLLFTKGNVCIIVNKMEAAGLLERRQNPDDQREMNLFLTAAAKKLMSKILPEHHKQLKRMLRGLSLPEQKTLHELLLRIDSTFDDPD